MDTISMFAGVGGIDLGFSLAGFKNIWANEIDEYASKTYINNFSSKLITSDIKIIDEANIPNASILLAGFPCQAFSIAGKRQGFNDVRGSVFFEILRVAKHIKPKIIFLENVKNIINHDNGNTFKTIIENLKNLGYSVKYKVLNACEYANIPQNRERIYILAFLNKNTFKHFKFPEPIKLKTKVLDLVNFKDKMDDKYYYTPTSCKFYNILKDNILNYDSIYQWRRIYLRENKSNLCPTLTANMGTGGHNVPIIYTKQGIRKLTPLECFKLQGFPTSFKIPNDISNTRLYKQAGNSVVVPLIKRIAENILNIL